MNRYQHLDYGKFVSNVKDGYKNLADKSVVVGLCARDVEDKIENVLTTFNIFSKLCKRCKIVVFENDSTDNTISVIKRWSFHHGSIEAYNEKLELPKFGNTRERARVENLAIVRNKLIDIIKSYYSDFDYLIISDADLQTVPVDNIVSSFGHGDFDLMAANGLDIIGPYLIYYDIWALVEDGQTRHYRQIHEAFPMHKGLVKVNGAFGGLAIYRICPELFKCRYHVIDFEDDEYSKTDPHYKDNIFSVEHTGFHFDMRKNGLNKMYINTSMVVLR
jgi:hypothetical protein